MTGPAAEVETDDIIEVYEFLVNAEVVEGPLPASERWSPSCGRSFLIK
jgi:hypothetical protein